MLITLFEGNRVETFTSLAAAAYAAQTWYSDLEKEMPPWPLGGNERRPCGRIRYHHS
jgi:hypothetical protein